MTPTAQTIDVNGISLAFFEWPAEPGNQEPALVFAHATGFHARVWDAMIERFIGRRIISIDLRGHGRSTGGPIEHWRVLSSDVCALLDHLGISGAIGIGHSMGAHTLLQCAADVRHAFSRLVLFDPVILAPEYYEIETPLFTPDNPHPTARRKRDFDSPEAMMERFRPRDPYDLFDARVFEDYCRHGLLPREDGAGYELACPPEVEASVYGSSRSNSGIHEAAKSVDLPTLIVRAKQLDLMDFKSSPTWPELASTMPNAADLHRPDRTHFHPFEDPADAAAIIERAMGE
ncbi:alpha/beta hydrolase [Erythrobacter rubeus]|uniref:Alpha/beta hydrolase n=1 Tax=Erythrobacter rubeus TaxID=2760803 RepID=A0ABR8KQ68_9SPHN|nr:alpha/beta hydrolase [Erythrobacter rubeus]MBD2842886.1 alpha/beta hydrolase [Erythrobacter rubeus]